MYKTSAVYNAFVYYNLSLGTKLEVRMGCEEMIVRLHRTLQTQRSKGRPPAALLRIKKKKKTLDVQKQLDAPGMFFTQHLDNKENVREEKKHTAVNILNASLYS